MLPYSTEAYHLLQDGAIALAKVEHVGMRVDEKYLDWALEDTLRETKEAEEAIRESRVTRKWRERFRGRTNYNSNEQLGKVLFEDMDFECPERTDTGRYRTDEETLSKIDHPFIKKYLRIKKIQKGRQFLKGIKEETCEGLLHPSFNLHIPRTYRSSSDSPNFQNIPVRDDWMRNLVRKCIRARKGRRLVEVDYGQIEVRGAYCYHRDPTMKKYLLDKKNDMHIDAAKEVFKLRSREVSKKIRYTGKNGFVFPEFYGSWWREVSSNLWSMVDTLKLETVSGQLLREHLREVGLVELGVPENRRDDPEPGSFAEHVKKVERFFWDERFPVYNQWRKDWYSEYLEKGFFKTLTGFICQGQMARNDVINYPVQGVSFHCLLRAFIWLVNEELDKAGMESQVIGQIHDSIVADVVEEEVQDFIELCRYLMTEKLLEFWKWIIIPLEIEVEVTPVGGSWVEKETWVADSGEWKPKEKAA